MKYRTDFVTNSSSSSFIIAKKHLTDDQIYAIRNHSELGKRLDIIYAEEAWDIEENEDFITGYTDMDNFSIDILFNEIGINRKLIEWGEDPFHIDDEQNESLEMLKSEENESEKWLVEIHKMREEGIS